MAANACPKCGRPVMTYARFLREAEPYRSSACGSCGQRLRRSRAVYALLAVMAVLLAVAIGELVAVSARGALSAWAAALFGIAVTALWTLLTNYLGFRLVGWVAADNA